MGFFKSFLLLLFVTLSVLVPTLSAAREVVVNEEYKPPATIPRLPTLSQTVRSDWMNVKSGCGNGTQAKGDGKTDDTEAFQACFTMLGGSVARTMSTVYIPPGKYVIKKTLVLNNVLGKTVIGSGETSVLIWAGQVGKNSTLIWSDGISRSRLMGFVLDGTAGCDIGIDHSSNHSLFETRLRHTNQKYLGFRQAGIRVGGYLHRVESAEIIYENCIFDSIGYGCKGLPYPPMSQRGCGAVALLNFNDYDNVFDGVHFYNNTYAIYNDKMANVYVRNSRFEGSTMADIYLAGSAGNSVRRSVSQGSAQFISSPARDPSPPNPTVIMDNRVDSWTGSDGAISYSLRGPVMAFDNQFTNAPNGSIPIQPKPANDSNVTLWVLDNNQLDGKLVNASVLLAGQDNLRVYDLGVNETKPLPPTPITPKTSFLKATWPLPGKVYDVTTFGANGSHPGDDTAGIQAAIDAAAKAGNGAMAYIPIGTYKINKTITISGKDFWVGGSGFASELVMSLCPPKNTTCKSPPAIIVSDVTGVTIEQLFVGAPFGVDKVRIQGGKGSTNVKLDGMYTVDSDKNMGMYNDSGVVVMGLLKGDVVHAIHVDSNLIIQDSSKGTVLVGMMIESVLTVQAPTKNLKKSKEMTSVAPPNPVVPPIIGFLTFIGLTQPHDIVVEDDESVTITDLYLEQQPGHIMMSGTGKGTKPGRVSIQGVKVMVTTPSFATIDNYYGNLFYMSGCFMEKSFPAWEVTYTGTRDFNLTLIGNNFDSSMKSAPITFPSGKTVQVTALANTLSNFTDINMGQTMGQMKDVTMDSSLWGVHAALNDFRVLGMTDLALNHPSLFES
eukprot:m.39070 g.39070  ORF g.39070 m.39070 type:complete len:833 (-) comp9506_c0_seq3:159-2657(-)